MFRIFALSLAAFLLPIAANAAELPDFGTASFYIDRRINLSHAAFVIQVENDIPQACWRNPKSLKPKLERLFQESGIQVLPKIHALNLPAFPVLLSIKGIGYTTSSGECVGALTGNLFIPPNIKEGNQLPIKIGGSLLQSYGKENLEAIFHSFPEYFARKIINRCYEDEAP